MPGFVRTVDACRYFYEYNPATGQNELVLWQCNSGLPEDNEITTPPWPSDAPEDTPMVVLPPVPTNTGPQALSATVTEGIRFIDNKFDRLTCPISVPSVLDERSVQDSENWIPLRGFPTRLSAGDNDVSTKLVASDFGFHIPAGAIIQGIKVEVDRSVLGSIDAGLIANDSAQLRMGKWWNQSVAVNIFAVGNGVTYEGFTSVDAGVSFDDISDFDGILAQFWDCASNADGSILLLSSTAKAVASPKRGISRSTDGGATWSYIGAPSATVPTTSGYEHPLRFLNGGFMAFSVVTDGATAHCWTSADGLTWSDVSSGNIILSGGAINDVFYWDASSRYYFTCISVTSTRYGLRTSTDGVTWSDVTGTNVTGDWAGGREQGDIPLGRHFAASGTTMLMIAKVDRLMKTTDTDADPSLSQVTTTGWGDMGTLAYGNGNFIVGCNDGVRISDDDGATWSSLIDVTGSGGSVSVLAYAPTAAVWLAIVASPEKVYISDDDGATWSAQSGTYLANDPVDMVIWE